MHGVGRIKCDQIAPHAAEHIRKEFQQALAELRTDLDVFSPEEAAGLMACGYQMASKALDRQLPYLRDVWTGPSLSDWPFKDMLDELRSVANTTAHRRQRLDALTAGSKVDFLTGSPSWTAKAYRWVRACVGL